MDKDHSLFDIKDTNNARTSVRIAMRSLHKVWFKAHNGISFPITNVSVGGLGCIVDEAVAPAIDELIKGELLIETKTFDIRTKIVHRTDKFAGLQFLDPPSELKDAIEEYFKAEIAALRLTQVEARADGNSKQILFRGGSNCELSYIEQEEALIGFKLTLFGNYIEGDSSRIIASGAQSPDKNPSVKGVSIYTPLVLDESIVVAAIRFIESIKMLNHEIALKLTEILRNGRK